MSVASLETPTTAKSPSTKAASISRHPFRTLAMLIGLYWLVRVIAFTTMSGFGQFLTIFYSPILLALAFFIWLVGFSRLSWAHRGWITFCLAAGGLLITRLVHPSMAMPLILTGLPVALTAVAAAICLAWGRGGRALGITTLLASALGWGYFTLLRFDGVDGSMGAAMSWRWAPRPEDLFLAQAQGAREAPADSPSTEAPLNVTSADWPEFRGVRRDGKRDGVRIATDWKQHPPEELWRRRIGPGWGSFSVVGDYVFTQDQRGDQETVICLSLQTGKELWVHKDQARFEEVVAGAGPRATPTFHEGKLYALGAAGRLNCLEAATGEVVWSRDLAADADAKAPQWGFSSSPLVTVGLAIVVASGPDGKAVVAYDAASGEVKWMAGTSTHSYSSPHLWEAEGGPQVLVASDQGLESYEPETGRVLWSYKWPLQGMARVVQPQLLDEKSLLLGTGFGNGTRLLTLTSSDAEQSLAEQWTSKELKPYFNDFVLHDGYAYGFDGEVFCCMNASTGKRQWKKGRYGHGQVLLLSEQGLLLVLSEKGELALLEANPSKQVELGKFQALSGKTWNHPVVVGDRLLVRNAEEAVCYGLKTN